MSTFIVLQLIRLQKVRLKDDLAVKFKRFISFGRMLQVKSPGEMFGLLQNFCFNWFIWDDALARFNQRIHLATS